MTDIGNKCIYIILMFDLSFNDDQTFASTSTWLVDLTQRPRLISNNWTLADCLNRWHASSLCCANGVQCEHSFRLLRLNTCFCRQSICLGRFCFSRILLNNHVKVTSDLQLYLLFFCDYCRLLLHLQTDANSCVSVYQASVFLVWTFNF